MRKLSILIAISALIAFALPVSAFAAPGYATADVHMRAGPGIGYPVVTTIPERARVEIHGCLEDRDWCDVTWDGYRGWVSAHYLEYFYEGHYVYLPDYFDIVHVPIVTFVLGTYWNQHYRGRPWFHRRSYWEGYWRTHRRPGARPRSGTRIAPPPASKPSIRTPQPRTVPSTKTPARRTPTAPPRRGPSVTVPQRPGPSTRTPARQTPSITAPTRRSPSGTAPHRRAPSTRSGSTPQQAPRQRQLQAPSRSMAPPRPAPRQGGGARIQRTAPRSGTKAPAGRPLEQLQRQRRQQQ